MPLYLLQCFKTVFSRHYNVQQNDVGAWGSLVGQILARVQKVIHSFLPVFNPPQIYRGVVCLKGDFNQDVIVLIVVGIFFGLGLIGLGILGYGIYTVAKSANITTNAQPLTESDLGVAIYPGAEQKANARMTIAGKDTLTATFLTSDSKAQVIAFYRDKLGPATEDQTTGNVEGFTLYKGAGESVVVTVSQSANRDEGKTQIVIVHSTNTATPSK